MSYKDPGPIPNRWLKCPRKASQLIVGKLIAFKTPLGNQFNDKVPEANRFTPSMLFSSMRGIKVKVGMWIDLTNTSRFYDKKEIEDMDCNYVKLQCRGHGETPSLEQTQTFIKIVCSFLSRKPLEVIGVHCTHGYNRTGFLMVSYLVEQLDFSLEAALKEFAEVRPPGIYKQDYLQELYKRYDDEDFTPAAPELPDWCIEEEEIDYDDEAPSGSQSEPEQTTSNNHKSKRRKEITHKKASFMPAVQGVDPFNTQPRLREIQKKAQKFCHWPKTGFPGLQPVSMTVDNLGYLEEPYRVSWKADGVRYMMLIDGEGEVYMLDRDNCAFKVHGLRFLDKNDLTKHLKDTLVDGELVIDKVNDQEIPRFLVYDVIAFEGVDVGKMSFYPTRLDYIEKEIVNPRHAAMMKGIIRKEKEPFSIRLKQFWDVSMAERLLGEKFAKSLSHEPDGLIFQPSKEPYIAGQALKVLKWKPNNMNSIDFLLKIVQQDGLGMVKKKIGQLFLGNMNTPFAYMDITKEVKGLNNKIIECKYDNKWVFMRERTDKSYPNSYDTGMAVWYSIRNPVTTDMLLNKIKNIQRVRNFDDSDKMPPPKRSRH